MQRTSRHILVMVLFGAGLAMLLYGLVMHIVPVYGMNSDKAFATVETALIKEVSIGGVERKADGTLHKTYTGKPPAACPT